MRGEQNMRELARNVIRQICGYLDAQAGAIYLLENKTLSLAGVYAYNERSDQSRTYQLGEGLIGQAAEEGNC